MLSTETHLNHTDKLKIKGWKKIFHTRELEQQLISDKIRQHKNCPQRQR